MRIRISDLMDQSCPEEIELGTAGRDRARQIEAMVMEKIGAGQTKPRRMRRKAVSTLLLAAAIALLLGSAAYAVSGWFIPRSRKRAISVLWMTRGISPPTSGSPSPTRGWS